MSCIYLVAVGAVEQELQEAVRERLSRVFAVTVTPLPALPEPSYALDPRRNQYSSVAVMHELIKLCPQRARGAPGGGDGPPTHSEARVLGLTERDLFIPMLSFIYGQAQLNGCVGVVSLARFRQEFYGQAPNQRLLLVRLLKEATHEIEHTLGWSIAWIGHVRCPWRPTSGNWIRKAWNGARVATSGSSAPLRSGRKWRLV